MGIKSRRIVGKSTNWVSLAWKCWNCDSVQNLKDHSCYNCQKPYGSEDITVVYSGDMLGDGVVGDHGVPTLTWKTGKILGEA